MLLISSDQIDSSVIQPRIRKSVHKFSPRETLTNVSVPRKIYQIDSYFPLFAIPEFHQILFEASFKYL